MLVLSLVYELLIMRVMDKRIKKSYSDNIGLHLNIEVLATKLINFKKLRAMHKVKKINNNKSPLAYQIILLKKHLKLSTRQLDHHLYQICQLF